MRLQQVTVYRIYDDSDVFKSVGGNNQHVKNDSAFLVVKSL